MSGRRCTSMSSLYDLFSFEKMHSFSITWTFFRSSWTSSQKFEPCWWISFHNVLLKWSYSIVSALFQVLIWVCKIPRRAIVIQKVWGSGVLCLELGVQSCCGWLLFLLVRELEETCRWYMESGSSNSAWKCLHRRQTEVAAELSDLALGESPVAFRKSLT